MFGGQKTNTFGQQAQQQNTMGFGQQQPTFGQKLQTPFGQPQQNTFGAPQPAGGNLFGAPQQQQQPTPFFGASTPAASSGMWNQQQQQPKPNIFGSGQPTGATSLFGGNQTSAFGATKPAGFGFNTAQPTTSLFGQTQPQQPSSSGGLFAQSGTPQGGSSLFGAPQTSTFGTPSIGGGGGNGTAIVKYQPQMATDTLLKGNTTSNVSTKQHCITFMKEYEAKSMEELRLEDYMANRKGPQAGTSSGGLFGSTQQATGMFGAQQQTNTLFGQQSTAQPTSGIFGTTNNTMGATSTFGQGNTSAFGQTSTAGGASLFGKPFAAPATTSTAFGFGNTAATNNNNQANTLFGSKPFGAATAQPTTLFGQSAAQPSFGQPAAGGAFGAGAFGTSTNQSSSLFAQPTQTAAPSFGMGANTSQPSFGGFGAPAATNTAVGGGLFGNNAAKPAFGATTGFGAPQVAPATTGFGFGQQTAGNSLFNNMNKPAAPAFGFGQTQPQQPAASLGGFGTGGTSLFGNTASKPGGVFGSSMPAGGSLFGQTTQQTFGGNSSLSLGGTNTFGANTMGMGQPQAQATVPIHQQILSLASNPYGDNPIFKDLKPRVGLSDDALKPTNPAAQKALLELNNQFKVSPTTGNRIKVKPLGNVVSKKSLFDGLEEYDGSLEDSFTLKTNAKRLIIKPRASPQLPSTSDNMNSSSTVFLNASQANKSGAEKVGDKENENAEIFQNQIPLNQSAYQDNTETDRRVSWLRTVPSQGIRNRPKIRPSENSLMDSTMNQLMSDKENSNDKTQQSHESGSKQTSPIGAESVSPSSSVSRNLSLLNDTFFSNRDLDETQGDADLSLMSLVDPHPTGIVLRRSGYYVFPSLDELLEYLDEEGRCIVPNFTVGRRGYGNVYFDEEMDVAGLNLDEIVHFRNKEIILYQDDETKPPVGSGLNRKAQVTLDQIWPHDKSSHEFIKDPVRLESMNYEAKLRRICEKRNTRFLEYRPETGSCVFKVDHFSKYTLSDSDDDDDDVDTNGNATKIPTDPKKAKLAMNSAQLLLHKKKQIEAAGKGVHVIKAPSDSSMMPPKSQESLYYLGQHMGQRSFQNYSNDNDDMELSHISEKEHPTSPSVALAMEMKTDSHKLQLMKASFFVDEDDEFDTRSVLSDMTEGRESPEDQMVPTSNNLFATKSSFTNRLLMPTVGTSFMGMNDEVNYAPMDTTSKRLIVNEKDAGLKEKKRQDLVPSQVFKPIGPKSQTLVVRPKVTLYDISDIVLPIEESILHRMLPLRGNTLPFFQGRRFNNGWSSRNCFTILNTLQSVSQRQNKDQKLQTDLAAVFDGRRNDDQSKAVIQIIEMKSMTSIPTSVFVKSIEKHLMIELKHDLCQEVLNSECPYFEANGSTKSLNEHTDMARTMMMEATRSEDNQELQFNDSVWSLMNSLWGFREELDEMEQDATSHTTIMLRRDLFSGWIESVVTDKDIMKRNCDYLDQLLSLIMCHKVAEACELAFMNDDINLAMLLSQLSGGPAIRQLIQHQLHSWNEVEADVFINEKRLKAFMLVAGIPAINSNQGGPINIFEKLDWIKCLALQLWYICSPTSSVTDALIAYEQSFEKDEMDVSFPAPPYNANYDSTKKFQDLRFHLMKLYSQRSHPMETLLHPANYTTDLCDFRLSYLLLQQLETLGYRHCSDLCKAKIYTSFAEQLENYNLWQWSIYILLHIPNQAQRELTIQQLLYRHIRNDGDYEDQTYPQKEKFIVESLNISVNWIYWAKAVRAGATNNFHVQAKYLLKAKQWSAAHEIIMKHIAPDAIINDNFPYLKSLLEQFEVVQEISNWSTQGQILVHFMELNEKFVSLQNNIHNLVESDVELFLEQIKPKLSDLCSVIKLFPCPTSKHRLCQCEISKQLAFIIRNFYANSTAYGNNSCALMRIALEKLPLPQEFAQQEFRHLLASFMKESLTIN